MDHARSAARARVVMVNQSGDVSGAEAVLLDHIALALDGGAEVVVACPPGPFVDRLPGGVRHLPLPPFGLGASGPIARGLALGSLAWRTIVTARALRRELRQPGTRAVVNSLLALPAVRLAGSTVPTTWLVHDVVVTRAQRAFVRAGSGAGGVQRAVAVSEACAAPLRGLGLDVVVRPNGVRWPVEPVDLALDDPPVVGSAALLVEWKGQLVLLDAVARLPGVRCELAGGTLETDRAYAAEVARRASAPDLQGRVDLLGHVPAEAAMRGWDVAVLASLRPEAGPLAALEALSLGLPIVATDHGGSAEYLSGGRGILVPPGDAEALAEGIRQALDPSRRAALAEAGRAFVAAHHDRSRTLPAQHRALLGDG
jgi:glycosyltransferase involved in cell wall biosynthesis